MRTPDEHSTKADGTRQRRPPGWTGLLIVAAVTAAPAAEAQVGHPPDASPYRDVRARQVASAFGGYLYGEAGRAGVGPTNGPVVGARYEFLFSGPVTLDLRVAAADLDRFVIDPNRVPDQRAKGTFSQQLLMGDVGLNLVFTGPKTWRGFAPFIGGALGMALGSDVPQDSSEFQFSTHFMVAPQGGFRWHPGDRLVLRVEARDVIWRLSYPDRFFQPPVDDPDAPPVLDPLTTDDTDWTHHLVLTLSIGWALKL
jgi:hypothetical protein